MKNHNRTRDSLKIFGSLAVLLLLLSSAPAAVAQTPATDPTPASSDTTPAAPSRGAVAPPSPTSTSTAPAGDLAPVPVPGAEQAPTAASGPVPVGGTPTDPTAIRLPSGEVVVKPLNGGTSMGEPTRTTEAAPARQTKFGMARSPQLQQMAAPATSKPAGTEGMPGGVDVANWQGNVNWQNVWNQGARFAYVKASEGTWSMNEYFAQQYNGSAAVGMVRGAYHFARPNLSSGASQAQTFVRSGGGWSADGKTLPGVLDLETNTSDKSGSCFGMSAAQLTSWTADFTKTYKSLTGRDAVIYTGYYFWRDCVGNTSAFSQSNPLWVPSYGISMDRVLIPGSWPRFTFWQFSDSGPYNGGDSNVFNGSYTQLQALALGADRLGIGMPPGAQAINGRWWGGGKSYSGWTQNGRWCLQQANQGPYCFWFGNPGDKAVSGDWNGDGIDTIGIVRNAVWQLSNSNKNPAVSLVVNYGLADDTPVTGDWDGRGRTSIGIVRGAMWNLTSAASAYPAVNYSFYFGNVGDSPLTGSWAGTGKAGVGVVRNGTFYLSRNGTTVNNVLAFGNPGDTPVASDWDGDGATTVGIVRQGVWQLSNSLTRRSVDIVFN